MAPRAPLPPVLRWIVPAASVLLAVLALPGDAGGQQTCDLVDSQGRSRILTVPGGRIAYLRFPVFRCSDGTRLRADSAVVNTAQNFTRLYRNVFYQDSTRILVADTAQYFSRVGRLQAQGNVRLTSTADSSVLTGQHLLYLRESEIRPRAQLTVTGERPHATLYPGAGDPADDEEGAGPPPGERPAPYEVDADRIYAEGQAFFRATGRVEITREDLRAFGERVEYDRRAGRMLIEPDGRIVSEGYELTGESVLLVLPEDELREVAARGDAALTGEELDLTAPEIWLFLEEGAMDRLVAVRGRARETPRAQAGEPAEPGALDEDRPVALAEDFLLRGDSIDVRLPDEVLETVYAVGRARGESLSRDSLNTEETPPLIRRDWVEGDTIVATFVPVRDTAGAPGVAAAEPGGDPAAGDSLAVAPGASDEREYRLERLVASGNARSLYRLAPSDTAAADTATADTVTTEAADEVAAAEDEEAPPGEAGEAVDEESDQAPEEDRLAVHYVVGTRITIRMAEGEVEWMEVEGPARGLHATPTARNGASAQGGGP